MEHIEIKECRKCGNNSWFHMIDSLAWVCDECGQVLVGVPSKPDEMEYGPSIKEWLQNIYDRHKQNEA